MPKKGETYSRIDINLQKWCQDYMVAHGLNQTQLAKKLKTYDSRVTEMIQGTGNTLFNLEKIVFGVYEGDYEQMAKYALTDEGLEALKDYNFRRKLTPLERDHIKTINKEIKRAFYKKQLPELIKKIKA